MTVRIYVYLEAGDNIDGGTTPNAMKSMDQAFAPVIAAIIPWAAVLGNRDQESNLPRVQVMDYLTKMEYCVCEILNPRVEDLIGKSVDRKSPIQVHGYGNYYLQVFGASVGLRVCQHKPSQLVYSRLWGLLQV